MKRFLISFSLFILAVSAYSQLLTSEKLLNYKNSQYGDTKWKQLALQIKDEIPLNEEKDLVYISFVNVPGATAEDIFSTLKLWAVEKFSCSECAIKVMDKELRCIIIQDYIDKIIKKGETGLSDDVSLKPIIRIDIKDGKVRITCTNSTYYVREITYADIFTPVQNDLQPKISQCYPLVKESDSDRSYITDKKTNCKALVLTHLSSLLYTKEIEDVLTNKVNSSNKEEW